ncbi:MAG: hypothetical protein EXR79_01650 [Myxococcales bacterium]|nr:hypothetical protein [Myxococcales bacterium]
MQFCGFEVTNAAGLCGVASHLTRAGATVEPWPEHVESALLPFEELAFSRSDWHGEINRALVMAVCGPYPGVRGPALDLLTQTAAAPMFAVAALEIAERMRPAGTTTRTRFDDIADRIVRLEAVFAARPATVPLMRADGSAGVLHVHDAGDLAAAALATLAAPPAPGRHVWAWLRRLQLLTPWAAPLVPGVVMNLGASDEVEAWRAAVTYAFVEGDKRLLLPWLEAELAAPGPLHAEPVPPRSLCADCATWGAALRQARDGALDELQTPPEPVAANGT